MKLAKLAGLIKKNGHCTIYHMPDGEIWLGTRAAIYRAAGIPNISGRDQLGVILDMDRKQIDKIFVEEETCIGTTSVDYLDLSDAAPEIYAKERQTPGLTFKALTTDSGELIFYDESFLAPLSDVLKESEYVEMFVREAPNKEKYIVVKDGLIVLAAIMPLKLLSEQFLRELAQFESDCAVQYAREKELYTEKYGNDKEETP